MKVITKDILPFQENDYFAPIRDKIDFARLLIIATRNLLLEYDSEGMTIKCHLKLIIDKMSRLFLYSEKKYFSISFPFNTFIENNRVTEVTSFSGIKIDFQIISTVISILESNEFKQNPSPIDFYIESTDLESKGLFLLEEILRCEPSYIRYDYDQIHQNGDLHPLHHLDINYSTYGTFKLGLSETINLHYFENLLNINKSCQFLSE